ncbi:MAG: PD-(D/E)XK nuclease family protein, partial [Verrucomicrobiaceae bacterium]
LKQPHTVYGQLWSEEGEEAVEWEPGEEEQQKATGWRLLETYFRESNIPADEKPDAVEVPVETDLSQHGLPTLVGVLDLVQRGKIIDFKSSSQSPNPEKVAHTTEVQTSSYAVLYREATGMQEKGVELHHMVKLKNPKLVITVLPPMSEQQQTRLFRMMESYVEGLDRRDWVPSPGMQCSSCEYFNECRRWS